MNRKNDAYSSKKLTAAAGIAGAVAGCGASSSLSNNVVPGAQLTPANNLRATLPTPFGKELLMQGYWQVEPDFALPRPGIFYFTNGNDLVVVGKSQSMSDRALAEGNAYEVIKSGALSAAKHNHAGLPQPKVDKLISAEDYHSEPAGGGKVNVYARGKIPLKLLPTARQEDFLEQANLETRVAANKARENSATASVGTPHVPPGEEQEGSNYLPTIVGGLAAAVVVGGALIYRRIRKQRSRRKAE
jgi:hypothetical protein